MKSVKSRKKNPTVPWNWAKIRRRKELCMRDISFVSRWIYEIYFLHDINPMLLEKREVSMISTNKVFKRKASSLICHEPNCWVFAFKYLAFTMDNPVYLLSTTGTRLVWPVSGECLPLNCIWSYLCNSRDFVLSYTRFSPKLNNSVQLTKKYFQKSTSDICVAVQSFKKIKDLRI